MKKHVKSIEKKLGSTMKRLFAVDLVFGHSLRKQKIMSHGCVLRKFRFWGRINDDFPRNCTCTENKKYKYSENSILDLKVLASQAVFRFNR